MVITPSHRFAANAGVDGWYVAVIGPRDILWLCHQHILPSQADVLKLIARIRERGAIDTAHWAKRCPTVSLDGEEV